MKTIDRIKQRLLIEELTRKRRSDDAERFTEVFRRATVDPNPHQIEAAMFALRRIPEGGAMLCDEVGLGKTIEAGLVLSQLRAEGKNHILVIVPLALARQWQVELQDLFSLRATIIGAGSAAAPALGGIYIVGREFASTAKGRTCLESPWDLIIVDEAHEMFAGIYTRFSKSNGAYEENLSKGKNRRAAQVKALMGKSPVLLLTATPLQNNLYELWGLVQYVDPAQRVLGRFNEFCSLFVTGEGGRAVVANMEETLRRRLSLVLKRTLRRQAQPFMKKPFRARHVQTFNFNPDKQEADLYSAINKWLAKETMAAYKKGHRSLMALQLRRRMASSIDALVATLGGVKQRMIKIRETGVYPGADEDLEFENLDDDEIPDRVDMVLLDQDLKEVERLEQLAQQVLDSNRTDAKKETLLQVIRKVESHSLAGVVSDKIVIFTESVRTLESLFGFLEENGFEDEITTFSGVNDGAVARRALKRWQAEVGQYTEGAAMESAAAIRGALIHEFRTRTRILIATEAGAKGLNLQFCNCLINYDLPWNPQRIEQRIGRVHRYGQEHDVVIINFVNLSNEAEQRVYDLLEKKLKVFQTALDSSDTILNTPEVALNLESRINEMLNQCRSNQEIQEQFDRLSLEMDEHERRLHDEHLTKVRTLMGDLDSSVTARLVQLREKIEPALSHCDEILLQILQTEGGVEVVGQSGPRMLLRWNERLYHLGPPLPGSECGEPLYREHPAVKAVVERCLAATDGAVLECESDAACMQKVYRVRLRGLEEEDKLLIVGAGPLIGTEPRGSGADMITSADLDSGVQLLKNAAEQQQKPYVKRLIDQIKACQSDMEKCGKRKVEEVEAKLEQADRDRRMASSAAARAKAQGLQTKYLNERETTRRELAEEQARRTGELAAEERRLRRVQFVEASPVLLFTIKHAVTSGRTP